MVDQHSVAGTDRRRKPAQALVGHAVVGEVLDRRVPPAVCAVEVLDGGLGLGSQVRISQPGMRPLVWTVSEFEQGRSFTWTSSVGGVTTVGSHAVHPLGGERCSQLILGLTQRGALAPVVGLLLGRRTRRYVGLEAAGLKAAAEDRARRALGPSTS